MPLQLSNHAPVGHSKKKVENFLVRTPLKLIVIGACPSSTSSLAPVRFRIENALEHKVDRVALLLAWAVPQVAAPLRLRGRTRSKPLKTDDAISGAVIHVTKSFGHLSAREPPDDKNFIAGFVKAFELSNPGPDALRSFLPAATATWCPGHRATIPSRRSTRSASSTASNALT